MSNIIYHPSINENIIQKLDNSVVEYEGIETTTNKNYFNYMVVSIRSATSIRDYSTTEEKRTNVRYLWIRYK